MSKYHIKNMVRGWFIGNFEPSVLKTTQFEVGHLKHHKGEKWPAHYHEHMREVNYLIKGKMIANNETISAGEIFIIEKNEVCTPVFLEECEIICVKVPSIIGDKVLV